MLLRDGLDLFDHRSNNLFYTKIHNLGPNGLGLLRHANGILVDVWDFVAIVDDHHSHFLYGLVVA